MTTTHPMTGERMKEIEALKAVYTRFGWGWSTPSDTMLVALIEAIRPASAGDGAEIVEALDLIARRFEAIAAYNGDPSYIADAHVLGRAMDAIEAAALTAKESARDGVPLEEMVSRSAAAILEYLDLWGGDMQRLSLQGGVLSIDGAVKLRPFLRSLLTAARSRPTNKE